MEEFNEELRDIPELYFLIAKFLSGGPLKETAKTLLNELERVEVLPRRLDWLGNNHAQSFQELSSRYCDVPWDRLAAVCRRALRLARFAPGHSTPGNCAPGLAPRLSLLSDALVRPSSDYSPYKRDHALIRRVCGRELGARAALLSPRVLCGLTLQRRTLGHLSAVYCLVFHCTGRYVVTGADDLLVKVWSAVDGRLVGTLRGAGAEITDVSVSADGALLAAGSVERLVRVWELRGGAPRAVLHAHQGTITAVRWAPLFRADVRWLASTSTDGSVAFWAGSRDGQFLSQPVQYVERMRPGTCHMICAAWSSGGTLLAAGSADHHVRLYTVDGPPRRVLEVAVHSDAVDSLSWAHRGLRFLSGSKDGTAALWTLHATQWRHVVLRCDPDSGHGDGDGKRLKVTMVCWDCTDQFVLTAVSDCTVRVWCARSCTQTRVLRGHRDEVYVLEAHPFMAGVVLSAGHDGQLFVWDAAPGQALAKFHNNIPGQGDGALFDAAWGSGVTIAASDSHGHLLLLGLGAGDPLLGQLPTELFFHTDYRPLSRDAQGGALDEQSNTPPHLLPPPFLVDVEGSPHPPHCQRLVRGRERMALQHLVPAADVRSRIDMMIEALAGSRTPPPGGGAGGGGGGGGVWRGEGVRHTLGSWQSGEEAPHCTAPIVPPLEPAHAARIEGASAELNEMEKAWYRREMRRRPVMITTSGGGAGGGGGGGARRKGGRRRGAAAAAARPAVTIPRPLSPEPVSSSDTSDWSVRLSDSDESRPTRRRNVRLSDSDDSRPRRRRTVRLSDSDESRPRRRRTARRADTHTTTTESYSASKTEDSSSSSQYSDWETGAALAPPARARRRRRRRPGRPHRPHQRYSPSPAAGTKRAPPPPPSGPGPTPPPDPAAGPALSLPEAYRPGEWLSAVSPRKAPYHPMMGDHCLYFKLGHQRYFEAVAEKDVYKVNARDKPWERGIVNDCEVVKVVGIKYVIKPPRVVCLKLSCGGRALTVKYHDMPDVIDFLVLKQQFDVAAERRWGQGDRFRCMIDDSWWTGVVVERSAPVCPPSGSGAEWASAAAAHFLCLTVRWDNGEVERLSPWDLEPLDADRLPPEPGGSVPVLPHELEAVLYKPERDEWPPDGDRAAACQALAQHVSQVMTLSAAAPFTCPVDLQQYPTYAMVVPCPMDLPTIRDRFRNMFYRRVAAAQFDARYLAHNAELFNQPHSAIVRQARLVTDLLLLCISEWADVDVVGQYHRLCASYHSEDDALPDAAPGHHKSNRSRRQQEEEEEDIEWRSQCSRVLRDVTSSADAEPFRQPVSRHLAPDYQTVVSNPMDLGLVGDKLRSGVYSSADQFAADMRTVFANSRLYNTNKRSRIYSMTVRLSALFESLWAQVPAAPCPRPRPRPPRRLGEGGGRPVRRARRAPPGSRVANGALRSSSSDSEPLAGLAGARAGARAGAGARKEHERRTRHNTKGKGVGKKSKVPVTVEPTAGPSHYHDDLVHDNDELYVPDVNGVCSDDDESGGPARSESGTSAGCSIEVVEEELVSEEVQLTYEEEVQLTYDEASPAHSAHYGRARGDAHTHRHTRGRKRRRVRSSGSARSGTGTGSGSGRGTRGRRKRHQRGKKKHKRTRERFTEGSSSSSSSSSSGAAGDDARRYESDRSYRPRYSTDDDAPLHLYRQRQREAGAGGAARPRRRRGGEPGEGGGGGGGVGLRARLLSQRYNEDSEDDSVAAISQRGHRRAQRRPAPQQSSAPTPSAPSADHNYYNGRGGGGDPDQSHGLHAHIRTPDAESRSSPPPSISSRGRVRKLTAKARGLLRE